MNIASSSGTGSLPSNTVPNPRGDLKVITTRSGVTLAGPLVSPSSSSKEVYQEPEMITDQVLTGSTNNVPPLVIQSSPTSTYFSNNTSSKMPEVTQDTVQSSTENIQALVAQTQIPIYKPVVAPKPKPTIPYPSRVNKQKLREKDDNLALKFVEIFRNLHFELSFADALLHMPKFALMFKSLLNKKEKLFDLATTPVNENCSAVILKKLPEKLGDPRKFLIPSDFPEFDECLALADLAITFKVGQTSKYSYNDAEPINRIDVINLACEEYVQEVLGFFDNSKSGNPTPISDPVISLSSPPLTPFEGGDFILEEIEACLTSKSIPPGINDTGLNLEGDIRLLEELLNNDPSLSPHPSKELNVEEIKTVKSSIDEPSELELKELPSHLEYAYLEGTDKLPVIIAKDLKDDEKEALLKEVIKLLDAGMIYPISDSPWASPIHCAPKKGGITVVENENNKLIPTRLVTGWHVCIDYQKLNDATRKDHFPLPFMDQMLERLAGNEFYCFLDGFSGNFQIPIDPQDRKRTLSPVLMEHLLIEECLLSFAMLPGPFKGI
uniref:Reverse transcriptase domain-containing protein n=1 Tax=Tanacetum cinerariifolium TaxID=118510 RepID=A0A699JYZ4_TANCI|nr:reverse transcriptase domain-containing protein [Tanacetum cinerariifolium]